MAPKKSAKTSSIWNFFTEKPKADKLAICNLCKQELNFKSTSNNLKKHMERKHPLVKLDFRFQQVDNPNETAATASTNITTPSTSSATPSTSSATPSTSRAIASTSSILENSEETNKNHETIISSKVNPLAKTQTKVESFLRKKIGITAQKHINDKLMLLFTCDFQPFSVVEDHGFKSFVAALNPSYQLPSRKTITNTMLQAQFEETYNRTKNIMAEAQSVTLTTDCWTSRNTESFLAVTAHFIDANFEVQSLLLDCSSFGESHTSSNLAREIQRIIKEWNLENKVLIIISDNAANIKKAIKEELKLKHFGCYAHTINLIAQDALKQISVILDKIKTIVGFFRRSSSGMAKLIEQQKQLNKEPKKLIQDVQTRWNSTYYMLERFIELEVPLRTTMALVGKDLPIISLEEWDFFKEIVTILKPLETITKEISGQKYVTASSVIILSDGLYEIYRGFKNNSDFIAQSKCVINSILEGIRNRLGDLESSNSLLVTTFLDPRFKSVGFSNENVSERAKKIVTSLISGNIKDQNLPSTSSENKELSSEQPKEKTTQGISIWKKFEEKRASVLPTGTPQSKAIVEIQRYLEEPLISREENPVLWWKNNAYHFPHLSKLFKEKFITIATSVPCEREFSKSGLILSDRRSRLSSTKVKQLLFLNSNQMSK